MSPVKLDPRSLAGRLPAIELTDASCRPGVLSCRSSGAFRLAGMARSDQRRQSSGSHNRNDPAHNANANANGERASLR